MRPIGFRSLFRMALTCGLALFVLCRPHAARAQATSPVSPAETAYNSVKHDRARLKSFLRTLPKGGILHAHLSGEIDIDLQIELASKNGFFIRVDQSGVGKAGVLRDTPYKIISPKTYATVPSDHRGEFEPLSDWLARSPHNQEKLHGLLTMQFDEPIQEFFGPLFDRSDEVVKDRGLQGRLFRRLIEKAHNQSVSYLELRISPRLVADRSILEEYMNVISEANAQWRPEEAVEVRFVIGVYRGAASTPGDIKNAFRAAADDDAGRDLLVGVDMVGLEEANGAPGDYVAAFHESVAHYPTVAITLHAGEQNVRSTHVRDSILLGARRIGHGTNLIFDEPNTMRIAKDNGVLIEVSLISNHLLLKTSYENHPFLAYLTSGIPVSLNTDDGAIFESTLTDEFTEAVLTFQLTWDQLRGLCENSLQHSFANPETKRAVIDRWRSRWQHFEANPPPM
jgi:adenosine deaminase CECR1